MSFITKAIVQSATIATSARMMGSTFRYLETLNPVLQQSRTITDPPTVLKREILTLTLAWTFALLTNALLKPLVQSRGWSNFRIQFIAALVGSFMAESIGRTVAYRGRLKALQAGTGQSHSHSDGIPLHFQLPSTAFRIRLPKALASPTTLPAPPPTQQAFSPSTPPQAQPSFSVTA
ncbi:MAG TPA: hypothetical protein V6C52_00325 [Coleofasciculaceae cyanobacterium]|jgi:hypothetical protein